MLGITNGQRAVWTFLFYTLISPFLAALVVLAMVMGGSLFGVQSMDVGGVQMTPTRAALPAAVNAYVWAALPAGLTGAALAALVSLRGTFGWLEAAAAGAVSMTVVAYITKGLSPDALVLAAFIAACTAVACRGVLQRARIVSTA
jgi:hypothetical protein